MPLPLIVLIGSFALLQSCQPTKPIKQSSFENFIQTQLPGSVLVYNESKDIALCIAENAEPATGRKDYLVVEAASRKIITRGSFLPGYIKWLNDNELEVVDSPGIIKDTEPENIHRKIISVQTRKP
ncbi:MAG: hypothetical protein HRU69_14330 [Flammeovirgaceae bacterium]|nr:MAG: hypothetical protein HRU69_14330 [Flammeovirgaceae bacterium]